MSKADYKIEGTVPRELLVSEVRKAARQFAMQFFHFSKVLYDQFGLEKTKDIVRQTVFELAVDRSDQLREKALAQGLKADSVEDFMSVIDLPFTGWIPEWGEDHCPYAEVWRTYFDKYPWFREIAPFYCDVIDTTTIENFSKCLSHRITQNVILEGYLLCSTAVWLSEPTTLTFGDGLWFSFETVSTIGFGDIPAETPVARAITVVLSVISIFYIAMLTGVAVNYCNTLIKMRQKDTMARFMDDLEHLEELDRDELADLSRRVREYRRRQR